MSYDVRTTTVWGQHKIAGTFSYRELALRTAEKLLNSNVYNNVTTTRPRCPACDSGFVQVRRDGSIVCRRCWTVTPEDQPEKREETL